jgi:hypothetical protein
VSLDLEDLDLLSCLYNKGIIESKHRRVDSIAGLCHIREKKGLKKRLRRLAEQGYLIEHHGPGYSLTKHLGVRTAQEHLGIGPRNP